MSSGQLPTSYALATPTSNTQGQVNKRHVPGLAFLRGLAALSVCLYHFTGAALPKLHVDALHELVKNGWVGVQVFFVISGFIIPYSLLGKRYSVRSFVPYITKRIVRINPPAYVALLLVLAQWYFIDYFIAHKVSYTADITVFRIAHNLLFTIPFSDYKWIIGIFWTLAIEFQFYIVIGLLFNWLFERATISWLLLTFALLSLVQYLFSSSAYTFFHYSSLFGMGGLTVYRYQKAITNKAYLFWLLILAVLAYVQCGPYDAAVGAGTALAIEYVVINNALTRLLGNISYSFYLTHVLVGNTCEFFLVRFISVESVGNRIAMQIVCVLAAVIFAYLFYLFIEQPFMRLAEKIVIRNKSLALSSK